MKTLTKLSIAALTLASAALFTVESFAADENNVVPGLTAVGAPLGLHGVDPVAFLDIGNRTEGSAAFAATHNGVAYYFSNEDNKATFEKNPERYVPQNGGFCTFGVSVGKKFDGDPQYASVVDGKLYVFLNEEIYKMYQKDKRGTIAKAQQQWKKIKHKAATSL